MFWRKKPKPVVLCEQLTAVLPPGMSIPDPLRALYTWIEQTHRCFDTPKGERVGMLHPALPGGNPKREQGSNVTFTAEGNVNLHYWFGHNRPEVISRLCVFANTGYDGSMAAFWLDDDGVQRIVHLGSGSGSTAVCILAEEPIDFLRLLAIGYDELCLSSSWPVPPSEADEDYTGPNTAYNDWLTRTFATTIPERATDIICNPAEMSDADPTDRFARWLNSNI